MLRMMDRSVPRGCGRRVSLKRRTMASSSASRKISRAVTDLRMPLKTSGKTLEPVALANIHHQGCRLNTGIVAGQLGELGNQLHRQVVHRVETQIFQRLQHGTLARAAQSGDYHQLWLVRAGSPLLVRQPFYAACAGLSFDEVEMRRRGGAAERSLCRFGHRGRPGNPAILSISRTASSTVIGLRLCAVIDLIDAGVRRRFRPRPARGFSVSTSGADLRGMRLASRHLVRALTPCFSSFSAAE